MRAVVCVGYGPPERLEFRDVEVPSPGPGDLLVRVGATTVNRTDCGVLRGHPWFARPVTGFRRPRHPILGCEFAGRVEAVGADVTEVAVGDHVFGLKDATFGGHAEYLVVSASGAVAAVPEGMSHDQAAPTTEGAHYAQSCLDTVDVGPGARVLVYGASGAIGSATVQLLHHRGVTVTAVCDARGVDLVASLGADDVVDCTAQDFTRLPTRFDVVIDAVGRASYGQCRPLLKPGAPYLTTDLGPGWQNLVLIPWTRFVGDHRVRLPLPRDTRGHVLHVRDLLAAGHLRPVVDRTYAFDEIVDAYRYVESAQKLGSVVVTVP